MEDMRQVSCRKKKGGGLITKLKAGNQWQKKLKQVQTRMAQEREAVNTIRNETKTGE